MLTAGLEFSFALCWVDVVDACIFIYRSCWTFMFCGAISKSFIKLVVDFDQLVLNNWFWIYVQAWYDLRWAVFLWFNGLAHFIGIMIRVGLPETRYWSFDARLCICSRSISGCLWLCLNASYLHNSLIMTIFRAALFDKRWPPLVVEHQHWVLVAIVFKDTAWCFF